MTAVELLAVVAIVAAAGIFHAGLGLLVGAMFLLWIVAVNVFVRPPRSDVPS